MEKLSSSCWIFFYRIKNILVHFTILRDCDLLVFAGAIGLDFNKIKGMIAKDLKVLDKSKILSIQTNKELLIAQKTKES